MSASPPAPVEPHAAAPPRGRIAAIALALALVTVLFRVATLGGSLGGFDDDHFVSFAYAKQVQAGARPVRDFQGVALQGVWPSLGLAASAGAQALFGNNLRTEGWLTAAGMGVGAALTFVAAARLAPLSWSVAGSVLSVLLAPKLYAYSKVLVLAAAAVLLIAYVRRPSAARASARAVMGAAAFLYRHDFAVYVGAGTLAAFAAVRVLGTARPFAHAAIFAALTLALLTPSLLFVQRHHGLPEYFTFAVENSTREAARTELSVPVFSMAPDDVEQNAVTWLYAVFMLLPIAAVVRAVRARTPVEPWRRAALIAIAATAVAANLFMLRANLAARFGDVAPLAAVLGAALCVPWARGAGGARGHARLAATLAALAMTAAAVWVVGSVGRELRTAGWPNWPLGLLHRVQDVSSDLARLPAAGWEDPDASDAMLLAQYLNRCTHPRDRVFQLSYTPEILPLAGRLFAGGIAMLVTTANTPESEAFVLSRLQAESVPIVLAEPDQLEPLAGRGDPYFPRLHAYLRGGYEDVGTLRATGEDVHILATTTRVPAGTFRDTGLPCFR